MLKMLDDGTLYSDDFDVELVESENPQQGDLVPGSAYWHADRYYTMQRMQAAVAEMKSWNKDHSRRKKNYEDAQTMQELQSRVLEYQLSDDEQAKLKAEGIRQYLAMTTGSLKTQDQQMINEAAQGVNVTYDFDPYVLPSEEDQQALQDQVDQGLAQSTTPYSTTESPSGTLETDPTANLANRNMSVVGVTDTQAVGVTDLVATPVAKAAKTFSPWWLAAAAVTLVILRRR